MILNCKAIKIYFFFHLYEIIEALDEFLSFSTGPTIMHTGSIVGTSNKEKNQPFFICKQE